MKKKTAALLILAVLAALAGGCNRSGDIRMKEEPYRDRRGTMNQDHHDHGRVNTNLPKGGDDARDSYNRSQNIRPGDSSGGKPDTTTEGLGGREGDMKPSTPYPNQPHY